MNLNIDTVHPAVVQLGSDMPDVAVVAVSVLGAALILFVLFVLPVWLLLHYRSRARKLAPVLPQPEINTSDLHELARLAERVEHRLDALESLMDAEQPGWRR